MEGRFVDGVLEGRFAMLLVDSRGCRIGEGGGVGRPYLVVRRGRRDGFGDATGREAISDQDIGFRGVVGGDAGAIGVGGGEANATVAGEGVGFSLLGVSFGFFACFVRTCS